MKQIISITFLLVATVFYLYSQETDTNLTVPEDTLPAKHYPLPVKDLQMDEISLPVFDSQQFMEKISADTLSFPKMKIKYESPSIHYFDSEYFTASPFNYSFNNWWEGGNLVGINSSYRFNDYLWTDFSVSLSSSFVGPMQPDRYNNASISSYITFQPHDRIRIAVLGQISLREGINPVYQPTINGGNYYGAELKIRIYKDFGFGIRYVNYYYNNNWTSYKYFNPVVF
ncbi:MAG: hypothetical protein LBH32_09770 [Dysgonamonadaceae bacterium]|jgi:hypothetical protein|nr:hypothetical protein [Dysgonamonadaceae bacterium]